MQFEKFLISENSAYLQDQVDSLIDATEDLLKDIDLLGARQIVRMADHIVSQIRMILHQPWQTDQTETLKKLQAIGVYIKNGIEEKKQQQGTSNSLREVIKNASQHLKQIFRNEDPKINDLNAPEGDDVKDAEFARSDQSKKF